MSNMYGYSDYDGPLMRSVTTAKQQSSTRDCHHHHHHRHRPDIGASCTDETKMDTIANTTKTTTKQYNLHHYETPNQTDTDDLIVDDNENVGNDKTEFELDHDEDDINPLQVGFWMDGDSLAPPCGTSVSMIHQLLAIVFDSTTTTTNDDDDDQSITNCLYDLGCGDGRICFEAHVQFNCPCTIGIELESDLIQRAQYLRSKLLVQYKQEQHQQQTSSSSSLLSSLPVFIQSDLRDVLHRLVMLATTTTTSKGNEIHMTNRSNNDSIISLDNLPLPTIIVLYLLPESLEQIRPELVLLLRHLDPIQIVCNTWGIPNLNCTSEHVLTDYDTSVTTSIFIYTKDCCI